MLFATQVASDAQLFAQQLKSRGYQGDFVGGREFDSTNFKFPGAYSASFSRDSTSSGREAVRRGVHKKYGHDARSVRPGSSPSRSMAMGISARARTARSAGPRCEGDRQGQARRTRSSGLPWRSTRPATLPAALVRLHDLQDPDDGSYNMCKGLVAFDVMRAAHPRGGPHVLSAPLGARPRSGRAHSRSSTIRVGSSDARGARLLSATSSSPGATSSTRPSPG